MVERAKLAKIHIAKKELALTDENYRDILHLHFQVESAAQLDDRQATELLNLFKAKGWRPRSAGARLKSSPSTDKKSDYITPRPGPAEQQQRKVLALWNELGYANQALHARVKKQFKMDRFEWLEDYDSLHILITDLQHRVDRIRRQA